MRHFILAMAALYACKVLYQLLEVNGKRHDNQRTGWAIVIAVRIAILLWATTLISAEGN